ncbi:MAG: ester cyclase [Nakamurella sp.]
MTDTTITHRSAAEQHKADARRVLEEIFPAVDDNALTDLLSGTFINHEAPPGTPPGPASVSYFMHLLDRAFSDQQWTIEQVLADGDMVAIRSTHSGRHTGDFFGLPATGRTFSYRQMHMLRFVDGKAQEHWAVRDDASLRQQLTGKN